MAEKGLGVNRAHGNGIGATHAAQFIVSRRSL